MSNRHKTIIKKIANSTFVSRSRIVFMGVIIAQLITFATSFVITGFFNPEDLGLLGSLGALISIVAGTLSFRLDVAVIQAKEEDALDVFLKSTALGMLACTLFSVICFFLPWDFAKKIAEYFILFVLWCWGYCFFFNSKQVPFKFNDLKAVSWGGIWRSAFTFIFQLVGGLIKPNFTWLLSGRVSGDYVGAVAHLWKHLKFFNWAKFKTGWGSFIKKHSDFLLYMTPHHLCIALSNNIIIFFLESNFGLAVVGFFALSQRLIQAPLEIIGSTMFNVTIQRFGELQHDYNQLKRFYIKVVALCFGVSLVLGFFIWGSIDYFIPLLGAKWADAAPMVKNLVPYFMSTLFTTPTTYFLRFVNKARLQLIIEVFEVGIKILVLNLLGFQTATEMVLGYSVMSLILSFAKTGLVFGLLAGTRKSA